jgi:uncharacterized protein
MPLEELNGRPAGPVAEYLANLGLVDHHVHGVVKTNPSQTQFCHMLTESDRTPKTLEKAFTTQVGFAVQRWCAPILDLPAHVSAEEYLQRRETLGSDEVNRRLLHAAGIAHYFIESGLHGEEIYDPTGMQRITGAKVDEVIRLETFAEKLATSGVAAVDFYDSFQSELEKVTANAIGLKSIAAYRIGLDFDPTEPSKAEVVQAAGEFLRETEAAGVARLMNPVLIRSVIWQGSKLNLPMQFHIGYGDPDLDLDRCDPLLMKEFIRAMELREIPIMLLHNYPYQRNAGYLAQMFDNVFIDVGLAVNFTGARSPAIIAESLELAPFHKILFSSDAWGLSELTLLGAQLFRRGLADLLDGFVTRGDWSVTNAIKVAEMIGHSNALSAYRLD